MILSARKTPVDCDIFRVEEDRSPWALAKGGNQEGVYRPKVLLWQSGALGCLAPRRSSRPRGRCQNSLSSAGGSVWQEADRLPGTVLWVTAKCSPVGQRPAPVWEGPSALGWRALLSLPVILSWLQWVFHLDVWGKKGRTKKNTTLGPGSWGVLETCLSFLLPRTRDCARRLPKPVCVVKSC